MKQVMKEAIAGQIRALPFKEDFKICIYCRWSKVCRATHLNN